MPGTIKDPVESIKRLEQSRGNDRKDRASTIKLAAAFEELLKLKDGALAYLDVTTTEDIIHLYGVDTEQYFEKLQRKEVGLKGQTNPNNYAILPSDIHLVVIEKTAHNEEVARLVINQIISALKEGG